MRRTIGQFFRIGPAIAVVSTVLIWCVPNIGCDYLNVGKMIVKYNNAITNCFATIPYAREFKTLFPYSEEHTGLPTGNSSRSAFSMKAPLHERYFILMEIDVTYDQTKTNVTSFSAPQLVLNEVSTVTIQEDGLYYLTCNSDGPSLQFGAREWAILVQNRGDFSSIGKTLITNAPIRGFRKYWEETQVGHFKP